MPRKKKEVLIGNGMNANLLKQFIDYSYLGNTSIAPDGFQIDTPLSDSRVKVYTKNNSKDVIVTHRGSVGASDWIDNARYALSGKVKGTKTYNLHRERHKKAVEKYGASNIIAIGHSRAGLYIQELQKEFPIKENITYNKASGFHDIGRENDPNQTDVRVGNDIVSLLAPLQKRPNQIVNISGTKNPLNFNTAHQSSEIDKLGDTYIGKKDEMEGSGAMPKRRTLEELQKLLKKYEKRHENLEKGIVYKTISKEQNDYDLYNTRRRIKNFEVNGEDLLETKKKGWKVPFSKRNTKNEEEEPKKEEPKKEEPKKEEPKEDNIIKVYLTDETNKVHFFPDRANANPGYYYHDNNDAYRLFDGYNESGNIRKIGTVKLEPSYFFKNEKPSYHLYPGDYGKWNGKLIPSNIRFWYNNKPFTKWNKIQEKSKQPVKKLSKKKEPKKKEPKKEEPKKEAPKKEKSPKATYFGQVYEFEERNEFDDLMKKMYPHLAEGSGIGSSKNKVAPHDIQVVFPQYAPDRPVQIHPEPAPVTPPPPIPRQPRRPRQNFHSPQREKYRRPSKKGASSSSSGQGASSSASGSGFNKKQLRQIILDKNKVIADLEETAYGGAYCDTHYLDTILDNDTTPQNRVIHSYKSKPKYIKALDDL
jgi:hypothetical protein